ncbi:hypothetical protein [Chryseobacterium sp.]|uniref:hypothetical protein n=1 Tax=Chryseobacterium sp. TaxID=1871047 RepID=UPI00321B7970
MKRKIFKYRLVYCLAVITSLLLFIISAFSILRLFDNFSIFGALIIVTSLIMNAFAFINLIEKYDKAVLFLNLSLLIGIFILGYPLLLGFLNGHDVSRHVSLIFLILFILILMIVNVFKMKEYKEVIDIENIGKHED